MYFAFEHAVIQFEIQYPLLTFKLYYGIGKIADETYGVWNYSNNLSQ